MPSVPGCIEHYTKLATAINEAHTHHKSLCGCWLDLANAYGSVRHDIINFSLNHYHTSPKLANMICNLYCGLTTTVSTKASPSLSKISLDPLSATIFNIAMNTYLDGLKSFNSSQSLYVLQYADDTCLVSDGPSFCSAKLEFTDQWLQ